MKQEVLLIMVLALGMCSINLSAQTKKRSMAKRTTTTRSTNSQQGGQVMKFRQVEDDGYIWYKLKRGSLFGARDLEGNDIIPIKYNEVSYYCNETGGTHCFYVKSGDFQGAYTRQGTLVISPDRYYVKVRISGEGGKVCWIAEKKGKTDKFILDAKGNEIFSLNYKTVYMTSSYDSHSNHTSLCYFHIIVDNNREAIYDLNGKLFIPLQEKSMYMVHNGKILRKYYWDYEKAKSSNSTEETINYDGNTQYNYSPYEDLYYAFEKRRSSSSSSSSNSSSSSSSSSSSLSSSGSSSNNLGNNTTTIHVEHHHDPVPVQQWQACWACGGMGTMGCDGCGGSGTKYIGDRLHRCGLCNGSGIRPCNICYGNKGKYITVYK